ncbi:Left-right determination factor 2 [Saguinus oedipus]|uniref:Left-right determination factor 2 n=1 Tax=Saguinus oedipus TaxID=9490 RepID=A0ABQ9TN99_SAGOE|nr:Left-right determination factor 2 [Saguinus oedipus]
MAAAGKQAPTPCDGFSQPRNSPCGYWRNPGRCNLRAPLESGEALLTPQTLLLSAEVAGRFLASEASTHLLVFGMEQRLPPNRELVQAMLRLFQEPVPRAVLHRHGRLSPRSDRARVTVEWLSVRDDGSNLTSLIDSRWGSRGRSGQGDGAARPGLGARTRRAVPGPRPVSVPALTRRWVSVSLVSVHKSGWKAFDVTEAVNFWQQLSRPRQPLLLQGTPEGRGEPQLELHTLDLRDYGAQGDCDPEAPVTEGTRCCCQEMYIDLQGMKWTENWVLEPPGFLAYECVGTCQQPPEALAFKWPVLGPRQCIASETASLPMIVSIKEGGRTRPQVVSLPNMRVQKCSCASDGALVPRRLQP